MAVDTDMSSDDLVDIVSLLSESQNNTGYNTIDTAAGGAANTDTNDSLWLQGVNVSYTTTTLTTHYAPYEIVWTGEVLFRVVTIIIVMILTIVGNTTLILIITCHPAERRKRVNIFLVNLALGDLMVCFFTMTTEILFVAFGEWVLGAAACKIIVYGQIVTLSSAVFLLTAMSVDRYQVLVQPLRSLTGRPRIWKKVASAWILSFIVAIPQLFIFVQTNEGYHTDGSIKHLCRSQGYTAKWQRKVYFTYLTSYILVLPTIIMSFCYINIIRVVWRRTDSDSDGGSVHKKSFRFRTKSMSVNLGNGLHNVSRHKSVGGDADKLSNSPRSNSLAMHSRLQGIPKKLINSSKRNVVKMTLSVIIGFLICWTPYFVVSLARIYSDYRLKLKVGLAMAEVMALVHSAMNPILYVIFCTRHAKAALLRMTRCLHFNKPSPPHGHDRQISMGDDGVSDDDTTVSFSRRNNGGSTSGGGGGHFGVVTGTCCTSEVFLKVTYCLCPCTKQSGEAGGPRILVSKGFYQEMVPRRTPTLDGAPRRSRVSSKTGYACSHMTSNSDPEDFTGSERRHTLSYVVANPVANSAVSAV